MSPSPLGARESSPHLPTNLAENSVRRAGEEPLTARGRRMGSAVAAGSPVASTLSERRAESQQQLRRRLWLQERHLELDRVRAELRASAQVTASQPSRSEAKTSGDATSSTAPVGSASSSGTDRRRLREEMRRVRSPGAGMGEDPRRTRSPGAQASQVECRESTESFTPRRDRLSLKTARQIRQRSVGLVVNEESPERSADATNGAAARTRSAEDTSRCLQKARDDAAMRRLATQTQATNRPRGAKPVADGGESSPRKLPFAGSLSGRAGHSETSPSRVKGAEKGSSCREDSSPDVERSPFKTEIQMAEKAIRDLQERKDRLLDLLDVSMPKEESQPTEDTDAAISSEAPPQVPPEGALQEVGSALVGGASSSQATLERKDVLIRSVSKPIFAEPVSVATLPRHGSTVDVLSSSCRRLEANASTSLISPAKQTPVVPALPLYKYHSQVAENGSLDPNGVVWSPRHEDPLSATHRSVQQLRSPRHGGASAQTKTTFPFASSPRLQTVTTPETEVTKPSSMSAPVGPSRQKMLLSAVPAVSTATDVRRGTATKCAVPQSPAVQDRLLSGRVVGTRVPMAHMMSMARIPSPIAPHVQSPRGAPQQAASGHMVCHARNYTGSSVAPPPSHAAFAHSHNVAASMQRANVLIATSATAPPAATWRHSPIVRSSSTAGVEQPM